VKDHAKRRTSTLSVASAGVTQTCRSARSGDASAALVCPTCRWLARLVGGDAIVLERIELEVPGHV
jgi:hypothetical protein